MTFVFCQQDASEELAKLRIAEKELEKQELDYKKKEDELKKKERVRSF